MTPAQKEAFATKAILATAKIAHKEMDDWGVELYVEALVSLDERRFKRAIDFLKENFRQQKLPPIAEILNFAAGRLALEDEATELAEQIAQAIPRFGRYQSAQAQAHLGEMGWRVVELCGGWSAICELPDFKTLSFEKNRWREMAKIAQKRAIGGLEHGKIGLPMPISSKSNSEPEIRQIGNGSDFED